MANIFKALSVMLSYPTEELQGSAGAISEVVDREAALPPHVRLHLQDLLHELATRDIYELQERYVLLFDRTRSLSLHLFEHVHGESRDRGQAMVDLQNLYAQHGLSINARELPDFLPLFLEFLAMRPRAEAIDLLTQTAHILAALAERLRKRRSPYESVFRALMALAAASPTHDEVEQLLQTPDPDPNDLAALDASWEEAPVRFGANAADCKEEIVVRLRAARRPAPGVQSAPRVTVTRSSGKST